jgi:predicted amidohydrolase
MFVIPSDFEKETERLGTWAVQHSMAVVFANYGGPSGGLPSAGGSAIWSETGERLVQLDATGAGVAVAIERDAVWRAKAVMISAL